MKIVQIKQEERMKFNGVEDLKQLKSDEELNKKCNKIIDSLQDFTKWEKFRILTTLYDSFVETCKEEGISFLEFHRSTVPTGASEVKHGK